MKNKKSKFRFFAITLGVAKKSYLFISGLLNFIDASFRWSCCQEWIGFRLLPFQKQA